MHVRAPHAALQSHLRPRTGALAPCARRFRLLKKSGLPDSRLIAARSFVALIAGTRSAVGALNSSRSEPRVMMIVSPAARPSRRSQARCAIHIRADDFEPQPA